MNSPIIEIDEVDRCITDIEISLCDMEIWAMVNHVVQQVMFSKRVTGSTVLL